MTSRRGFLIGIGAAVLGTTVLAGCSRGGSSASVIQAKIPDSPVTILDQPSALELSQLFLERAEAVVVVPADDVASSASSNAAAVAGGLGVPLLVESDQLDDELERLDTSTVVSYLPQDRDFSGYTVITGPEAGEPLPEINGFPFQIEESSALVLTRDGLDAPQSATLASAGVAVIQSSTAHPGADIAATTGLKNHSGPIVGIGDFGDHDTLSRRIDTTRSASELPGGGIIPFPARRMIALYGHPESAALGVLGEQPPAESVARVTELVNSYQPLWTDRPTIGAFEIIATVASGSPTEGDDYSSEAELSQLTPWIDEAENNQIYSIVDFQPGRTDFLTQVQGYRDLLLRPTVGVALDPEWRIGPNERHLDQIGHVDVDEVNSVISWLAQLVSDAGLPTKLLVIHQFQVQMIRNRERLDLSHDEVQVMIHVDGQGAQPLKQATWQTILNGLTEGVPLGWKNFIDEDAPMLTPEQTVQEVRPVPDLVSYQ